LEVALTKKQIKLLNHSSLFRNKIIAILASIPLWIAFFAVMYFSNGLLLVPVAVLFFSIWFIVSMIRAIFIGSSILVSEHNFPEVLNLSERIKNRIGYSGKVEIYICDGSRINATLMRYFNRKILYLTSKAIEETKENQAELVWLIARHYAALRVRQSELLLIQLLILWTDTAKVMNLFIYPYFRSVSYTGDMVGLALCGDLASSISGLNKLLMGGKLYKEVSIAGIATQSLELKGNFFGWITTLISPEPHMVNRHLNLVAFTHEQWPGEYERYMSSLNPATRQSVETQMSRLRLYSAGVLSQPPSPPA